jgi:alginate production protein
MAPRRAVQLFSAWALPWVLALAPPAGPARAGDDDDELRERLTEREDKRRPLVPWSVDLAGRPLTVGGEFAFELGYLRHRIIGEDVNQTDRLLLEPGLQLETFYSFGPVLSIFSQIEVVMEEDLLDDTVDGVSDIFVERGEMWLYSENIAGTHLNLDLGRLDFEDDRRWWWDDELDAVRVAYERETFEIALAAARELGPDRSDQSEVDPENERVFRLLGEGSWDWSPNHAVELFLLYQDDHSPTESPGEVVSDEREDDSDARLTWLGARLIGVFELETRGLLGYWLDTALVVGDEKVIELEDLSRHESLVEGVTRRDVFGWGLDAGINWMLPLPWEPRLYAGYAFGSGDSHPEAGDDRSYRQTGTESDEAGFGGVERFPHYGIALDPELSNLGILTIGAGLSLLRSSSLDLVYHYYRLVDPAAALRDSRLEAELDGEHRNLGHGVDLVLAVEEWERFEIALALSAFRAGPSFGMNRGTWSYGGFLAVSFAF